MACPGHMDGAFVGRHEGTGALEDVAVPHRAVAHRGLALLELEVVGTNASVLPRHEREDLPAPRIEDRAAPRAPRGERVECRDTGDRNPEGESERPRCHEPHPKARVASRACSDDDPVERSRLHPRAGEHLVDVVQDSNRPGRPLAEDVPVPHERAGRCVGRGVEGEGQHREERAISRDFSVVSTPMSLRSDSRSCNRTAARASPR